MRKRMWRMLMISLSRVRSSSYWYKIWDIIHVRFSLHSIWMNISVCACSFPCMCIANGAECESLRLEHECCSWRAWSLHIFVAICICLNVAIFITSTYHSMHICIINMYWYYTSTECILSLIDLTSHIISS